MGIKIFIMEEDVVSVPEGSTETEQSTPTKSNSGGWE